MAFKKAGLHSLSEADTNIAALTSLFNNPPVASIPFVIVGDETLNGDLAYTRAGETGNVNLSGVSETLAADVIPITENGASFYEEFDNELLWSEDYLATGWAGVNAVITLDAAVKSSDLIASSFKIDSTATSGDARCSRSELITDDGSQVVIYTELRKGDVDLVQFDWVASVGGTTQNITNIIDLSSSQFATSNSEFQKITKLNDGWIGVYVGNTQNNTGNATLRIDIGTGNQVPRGYVHSNRSMMIKADFAKYPYRKTTATTETRGADTALIDMMNNMPAAGQPFTIMCDCADIPISDDANAFIFSGSSTFYARRQVSSGVIQFSTGGGVVSSVGDFDTINGVRFHFVYDGVNALLYADGVLLDSGVSSTPVYDVADTLAIGSYYTFIQRVNSEIKNISIYHYALSNDAIFAKGGA